MDKAVTYVRNRKPFLETYLEDGAVASLITYQRMLSDHLRLAERTGCFQNPRQELKPVQ